ncbi:hypothetical protein M441DRAFT_237008 [Trichoderma asperellum CBS 433.97]|uniref:Uncharacterized protein n=1 Tax=Trichoderma asperellum (strain ATCC 204424 / CBS 433.97 / NBRC 101777) TaxID=1042311 RepID=A0A2T3Z1M5_TRIA4|nr:hypothetical protein M441DRAFT_237008 [Trichoderma asperellum CBS 433.97]PTB38697.1 hypothetical protein M441DRAFT_237008 [Trichoderma asperellum CBS 433.97]
MYSPRACLCGGTCHPLAGRPLSTMKAEANINSKTKTSHRIEATFARQTPRCFLKALLYVLCSLNLATSNGFASEPGHLPSQWQSQQP